MIRQRQVPAVGNRGVPTDVVRRVECTFAVQDQLMHSLQEEVKKFKEQASAVCSSIDEDQPEGAKDHWNRTGAVHCQRSSTCEG